MPNVKNKLRIDRRYFVGMNSFDSPSEIHPSQCALLENGIVTEAGVIVKRKGLTAIGSAITNASSCNGIGTLEVSGVARLFRIERTNLYMLNGTTWDIKKNDLTNALDTTFQQANGVLFLLNGTDNVHSVDTNGTVTDEGNTNTDPPKGTIAEFHDNRLFVSGVAGSNEDLIYFSDVADPHTFDLSTNNFKAWKGSKGKVTQLKSFKEKELIIYKQDTILQLSTDGATPLSDWSLSVLNNAVGCPAGQTVANVGNDHIFLGNDGVRILSRSIFDTVQEGIISREVQNYINDINWNAIETARAVYYDNKYILAIPTGSSTTPDVILIYDTLATLEAVRRGISLHSWVVIPKYTWDITHMSVSKYNTAPSLVIGGTGSKLYSALNGTTDDGTHINLNVHFREEAGSGVDIDDKFSHFYGRFQGSSDTVSSLSYVIDRRGAYNTQPANLNMAGSSVTIPFVLPVTLMEQELLEKEFYLFKRGKICQVRFQHNQAGTAKIYSYTLYYQPIGQTE